VFFSNLALFTSNFNVRSQDENKLFLTISRSGNVYYFHRFVILREASNFKHLLPGRNNNSVLRKRRREVMLITGASARIREGQVKRQGGSLFPFEIFHSVILQKFENAKKPTHLYLYFVNAAYSS